MRVIKYLRKLVGRRCNLNKPMKKKQPKPVNAYAFVCDDCGAEVLKGENDGIYAIFDTKKNAEKEKKAAKVEGMKIKKVTINI